ncbi:MAG TPA: hypothetical protein VFX09_00365 [Burkholderiales bacterium]|nr:hypothetical protein [Burkholderiales bacterium]
MNLLGPCLFAILLAASAPALAAGESVSASTGASKPSDEQKIEITVKGASTEAQAKAILRKDVAIRRCVIKPVMTDQEIADCKAAYRR